MMMVLIAKSPADRAACLAIRMRVFVDEQGVPAEEETDEYDADAVHLLLRDEQSGEPVATARLVGKGDAVKIGRMAVLAHRRGQGLGRAVMCAALDIARAQGFREAVLTAQTQALPFYHSLGFVAEGEEFLEAGIPHFLMRRALNV